MISQADAIQKLQSALSRLEFFALRGEVPPQDVVDYVLQVGFETMPNKIIPAKELHQ